MIHMTLNFIVLKLDKAVILPVLTSLKLTLGQTRIKPFFHLMFV